MNVSGRTILAVFRSPWEAGPGIEIPDIAPSMWRYCTFYLELEGGVILRCAPGDVGGESQHVERQALNPEHARAAARAIGARVLDVFDCGPSVYIMLTGGACLEATSLPDGSALLADDVSSWTQEELDETALSMLTGKVRRFRDYVGQ